MGQSVGSFREQLVASLNGESDGVGGNVQHYINVYKLLHSKLFTYTEIERLLTTRGEDLGRWVTVIEVMESAHLT